MRLTCRTMVALAMLAVSFAAGAQLPAISTPPADPVNGIFPKQNPRGPVLEAYQQNYPYEGQCVANPVNKASFPLLPLCSPNPNEARPTHKYAPSFACPSGLTAGGWAPCAQPTGAVSTFTELTPLLPGPTTPRFVYGVVNPPFYAPNNLTYPGADYYELQLHEAWGFDALKGLFGLPATTAAGVPVVVPNGKQWTGIVDAAGNPLYTPIWGIGSKLNFPIQALQNATFPAPAPHGAPASWSNNDFFATWPSISIKGTRGTPVVVKWVNEFPNQHVYCPHPEAADWPCAIDRTFMGVKAKIDVALKGTAKISTDGVNEFGSPQQPDNSWVTHLHGGEIPPSTDGFAELWFGNANSAAVYAGLASGYVTPPFENPLGLHLERPLGNAAVYTYPMVQDEATIWFHDHTLGKTHHNVIAGPAGFFPVVDPNRHLPFNAAGVCTGPAGSCDYTFLDAFTADSDLFFAIQDRAFNNDGSINFSNTLGQAPAPLLPLGTTSVTSGVNPLVHPVWWPEYFGDHAVVNGVIWPARAVGAGWNRIRLVNGSDSRCWTIGFSTVRPAPGAKPANDVPVYVLANDQGYLRTPALLDPLIAPTQVVTMCPGERYELLINFAGRTRVTMTNSANAPFPNGISPFAKGSPDAYLNAIMEFVVDPALPAIATCAAGIPAAPNCIPSPAGKIVDSRFFRLPRPGVVAVERQVYLNEKVDGVTLAPLGMQLNGVPFEYKVTETPRQDSTEIWKFINLTVDAHPMHPHLVRHQIVSRQGFNVGAYKALLCGSTTCQPGPAPGNEMQVVPDVTPLLRAGPTPPAPYETGWKDASVALPGMVTTIIAEWTAAWGPVAAPNTAATAPGTLGGLTPEQCNPAGTMQPVPDPANPGQCLYVMEPVPDPANPGQCLYVLDANGVPVQPLTCQMRVAQPPTCQMQLVAQPTACTYDPAAPWSYESVSSGPYVWHCHINSHEDSEMMRTSLVVP